MNNICLITIMLASCHLVSCSIEDDHSSIEANHPLTEPDHSLETYKALLEEFKDGVADKKIRTGETVYVECYANRTKGDSLSSVEFHNRFDNIFSPIIIEEIQKVEVDDIYANGDYCSFGIGFTERSEVGILIDEYGFRYVFKWVGNRWMFNMIYGVG